MFSGPTSKSLLGWPPPIALVRPYGKYRLAVALPEVLRTRMAILRETVHHRSSIFAHKSHTHLLAVHIAQ